MSLCTQPLNHIKKDQLGNCVGERSRKVVVTVVWDTV